MSLPPPPPPPLSLSLSLSLSLPLLPRSISLHRSFWSQRSPLFAAFNLSIRVSFSLIPVNVRRLIEPEHPRCNKLSRPWHFGPLMSEKHAINPAPNERRISILPPCYPGSVLRCRNVCLRGVCGVSSLTHVKDTGLYAYPISIQCQCPTCHSCYCNQTDCQTKFLISPFLSSSFDKANWSNHIIK